MTAVVIFGGRWFADYEGLCREMDALHRMFKFTRVIEGDARGADRLGGRWAASRGIAVTACPADWNGPHGRRAGFIRNQSMLDDHKPDVAVGFPGGNGTADMARRCERAGVPVFRIGW